MVGAFSNFRWLFRTGDWPTAEEQRAGAADAKPAATSTTHGERQDRTAATAKSA
ncbi:MAG: hypothetical protein O2905_05100 [Proteobacteria bacterium]|nr:hypothetical protein [Pseudomonadota bacterium]